LKRRKIETGFLDRGETRFLILFQYSISVYLTRPVYTMAVDKVSNKQEVNYG